MNLRSFPPFQNSCSGKVRDFAHAMKTALLLSLQLVLALGADGEGSVDFKNRSIGSSGMLFAPVYGVNPLAPDVRLSGNATINGGTVDYTGVPLLTGANFIATLWAAPLGNGLVAPDFQFIALGNFSPLPPLAGIWRGANLFPTIPWVDGQGEQVLLQIRVWDSLNGSVLTWDQVLADPTVPRGHSEHILYRPVARPLSPPPMLGLQSFNLFAVPEPGFAALGSLGIVAGLAAWFQRRRHAKG